LAAELARREVLAAAFEAAKATSSTVTAMYHVPLMLRDVDVVRVGRMV
jgi:hypothetical protein